MAYATKQQMIDRFGEDELVQLSNRDDRTSDIVQDVVLDLALDDASAEIDAVLSGKFNTPIADPPAALVRVACEIARYHLYSSDAPEDIEKKYQAAVKLLKSMRSGDINPGSLKEQAGGSPAVAKYTPVFNVGMFD